MLRRRWGATLAAVDGRRQKPKPREAAVKSVTWRRYSSDGNGDDNHDDMVKQDDFNFCLTQKKSSSNAFQRA